MDSGIPYPDPRSLDQTGAIVLKLMKDFIGKCYTVYAENFNNSVNLTKQMSSNCRYICETLRADKKIIPDKLFGRKLERESKWKWKDKSGKIKFKYAKKKLIWKVFYCHKTMESKIQKSLISTSIKNILLAVMAIN